MTMSTIKMDALTLSVNVEATQKHCEKFVVENPQSQCYRNYLAFCNDLREEERGFFDFLGIDPLKCDVHSAGMTKKRKYPTVGSAFIVGSCEGFPEPTPADNFFTDKAKENKETSASVQVGRFSFTFLDSSLFSPVAFAKDRDDNVDYAIWCVWSIDEMPWLLAEKCANKEYVPAKRWQLIKRLQQYLQRKHERQKRRSEIRKELENFFEKHGIAWTEMRRREITAYQAEWVGQIVPKHNRDWAMRCCFPDKGLGYLWHVFSYGCAPYAESEQARRLFDAIDKFSAVLCVDNEQIGYRLSNVDGLVAEELRDIKNTNDVVVTAQDFAWSYAHTHEEPLCGPYYYQKGVVFNAATSKEAYVQDRVWSADRTAYFDFIPCKDTEWYVARFYVQDHDDFGNCFFRICDSCERIAGGNAAEVWANAIEQVEKLST